MIIRPKIAGDGRGLTTGGGGDFTSSAPGSSPSPRIGTPGTPATSLEGPRPRGRLTSSRKERNGYSGRSDHGRHRVGRKGNSVRKGGVRSRECGSKVRKVRRTSREYYGTCLREETRRIRDVERSVVRISSGSKKNRSESLGRYGNRKSG